MKILVTGATGNIGRMLVDHLLARGASDVRALTNDRNRAALPAEVEVFTGYLRKIETVPAALEGVDRMYLAPTPDTVGEVVALARQAGVRHIVDLSGEPESWWGSVAEAVEASGIEWTHLCPWDFMENATSWAPQIRATGAVREPYPKSASAPIAMDDIAAVAATVLLEDTHASHAYTLTGPETLTRVELVRQLGDALGRHLPFIEVSRDEAVDVLAASMGENAGWYVDNVLAGFDEQPVTATRIVEEITGRPATTFAQWARDHAHQFLGSATR
ncbi:MAG: NAD(P)H-binding protein [Pseudonocardia sp.]